MDRFDLPTLIWGVIGGIGAMFFGLILLSAIDGNNDLSKRGYELDQKAYTACVATGHWTPVECRAGEYGIR